MPQIVKHKTIELAFTIGSNWSIKETLNNKDSINNMSFKGVLLPIPGQCLAFFEQTIGKANNGMVKTKKEDFW